MSELIPRYDSWKTTPPEEPEPKSWCSCCGATLYEGDYVYTILGEILCDDCLRDNYGKTI